ANLVDDLNRIQDYALYETLMENAITVAHDPKELLPIRHLETKKIAYVSIGKDDGSAFYEALKNYGIFQQIENYNINGLKEKQQKYNTIIVRFHKSNDNPWKSYEFTNKELTWLYEIARTNTVILNIFTRPYALLDIESITNIESVVVSYQNS